MDPSQFDDEVQAWLRESYRLMGMQERLRVSIRREQLGSPAARHLIAELDAELSSRYPEEGATHFRLDTEEVAEDRGGFFVAYLDGQPVGCGAIRRLDDAVGVRSSSGEIKRMYVTPAARGKGVGRALLTALETEAGRLGLRRLVLETGSRQTDAVNLYRSAGFRLIPAFGEYVDSPLSVCMGKDLQPS